MSLGRGHISSKSSKESFCSPPVSQPVNRLYEFGPFRIETGKRVLLRHDVPVPLAPKAFDMLLVMVQHHGQVLDKDKLMDLLWPESDVEEANLPQNVSALRKALGESPNERGYILTIPGRGYKFAAEVEERNEGGADSADSKAGAGLVVEKYTQSTVVVQERPEGVWMRGRSWLRTAKRGELVLLGASVFLLLALVGLYLKRSGDLQSPSFIATSKSIAVLPFKPLVADNRDESLEMGMADTLNFRMSSLRDVTVRPISSVRKFSGLEQDPVAAGRELGVESVLDGQIQRWGDRIRVTARLIGVGDGKQLWAGQFDEKFTDIFTVQDLISEKVISALALKLTAEEQRRLTKHYTENAEAYQLYVNGRFYWERRTPEGLQKAIEYFEQAIGKDQNYAVAYAGLADAYALLGVFHLPPKEAFPKSKEAALNALRIDDRLAEAHAALGHVNVQYEYDWAGAEREYKRAIELNPNYVNAHHFYALYLSMMGRFDEGIAEIKRAQELEPFSLFIHTNVGSILYQARRYDEAINQLKSVLEMDPNFALACSVLGHAYLQKGMHDQAIAEFQKRTTPATGRLGDLGQAYGLSGRRREALKEIDKLQELSKQRYVAPYNLALIYASLGDNDNALEWLERAYEDRSTMLIRIRVDPRLDKLRSEPRFKAVMRQMGLE